ncbi:MAG: HAMP domain-containing protein, partial [Planctomycetes bacterium]|nr:HAMP domain-containing protein [Planctomycetota bacterium]
MASVFSLSMPLLSAQNRNIINLFCYDSLNVQEIGVFLDKARQSQEQYKTFELKLLTGDAAFIYGTSPSKSDERLPAGLLDLLPDKKNSYKVLDNFLAYGKNHQAGKTLFALAHSGGFRDFKGLGWHLIAQVHADEMFNPVSQMKVNILVISLAITLLSVILGLFVSHTISNPIQKLTADVSRINRDNLNVVLEVKSNDETGRLAKAFNTLIQDLKATTSSIEDLNREVSQRRKAEEKLNETCAQLEQANKDIIGMQSQLIQNEKLVSIGHLAAGVAHEINNPVGFVFSNFETLENYGSVFLKLISSYDELIREVKESAHA